MDMIKRLMTYELSARDRRMLFCLAVYIYGNECAFCFQAMSQCCPCAVPRVQEAKCEHALNLLRACRATSFIRGEIIMVMMTMVTEEKEEESTQLYSAANTSNVEEKLSTEKPNMQLNGCAHRCAHHGLHRTQTIAMLRCSPSQIPSYIAIGT